MKKDVSIIIVNYCSANLVIDLVRSIFEKTSGVEFEIIVVDNASGDESVQKLKTVFGNEIQMIEAKKNLGFGKANNLGATYAKGDYLFLLNPDTILLNNAIYILWKYMYNHPEVGVAGGNLYTRDHLASPSYCMSFDDIKSERMQSTWRNILNRKIVDKLGEKSAKSKENLILNSFNYSDRVLKVAYIFGADMMMQKALFDEVGGFDPDFFMYAEEEELSWRITKKGYEIVNVPDAHIIHLEGVTSKEENSFSEKTFSMRMNGALTYYWKRFGIDGVRMFYKYRSLRYKKLIKLAKIRRKDINSSQAVQLYQLLTKEYKKFMREHG